MSFPSIKVPLKAIWLKRWIISNIIIIISIIIIRSIIISIIIIRSIIISIISIIIIIIIIVRYDYFTDEVWLQKRPSH